jgi:hypothetical protein
MNGTLFVPICDLTPELRDILEFNGYQIIKIESGSTEEELR